MSTTSERNAEVSRFIGSMVDASRNYTPSTADIKTYRTELAILEALIPIQAAGFRGIVITALAGMHIDPKYRATQDFYACNPRSIFEQGIHGALQTRCIPCGKSDPLNVAKNIDKIDNAWAKDRRPESAALAAVRYLNLLEQAIESDSKRYNTLAKLFFARLCQYASTLASLNVKLNLNPREAPINHADRLARMTVECPEGGTIPQFIIGNLLRLLRKSDSQYLSVEGVDESVFGTNTTSKKPADIWEVMKDGQLGQLYEVTVKHIDMKRLNDCVTALADLGIDNYGVTFICRLDQDVQQLPLVGQSLIFNGVGFQFLDIHEFIRCTYTCLSQSQQIQMLQLLASFVGDHNRKQTTKQYWANHFGS